MNFACNIPKKLFILHVVAFVFSFALVLKNLISLGQNLRCLHIHRTSWRQGTLGVVGGAM